MPRLGFGWPRLGIAAGAPRYNHPVNREVFAAVADALERGEPAALVTIVATHGSTPQRVGAKMLVYADGRIVGTIGGGCYENDAFWKAILDYTNDPTKLDSILTSLDKVQADSYKK